MSQCGNAQRLWKDRDASKSTVAPSGGFITIMTWQAEEYTAGLLSLQGGCCFWTPSPCHFISTSTCLHQLWKIVGYLDFSCLTDPEMPQRVCKNPWKSLKTTSTVLLFSSLLVTMIWRRKSNLLWTAALCPNWFDFPTLTWIWSILSLLAVRHFISFNLF